MSQKILISTNQWFPKSQEKNKKSKKEKKCCFKAKFPTNSNDFTQFSQSYKSAQLLCFKTGAPSCVCQFGTVLHTKSWDGWQHHIVQMSWSNDSSMPGYSLPHFCEDPPKVPSMMSLCLFPRRMNRYSITLTTGFFIQNRNCRLWSMGYVHYLSVSCYLRAQFKQDR